MKDVIPLNGDAARDFIDTYSSLFPRRKIFMHWFSVAKCVLSLILMNLPYCFSEKPIPNMAG